ncbi:PREDICTED: cystatin-like, partial [Leptosomus discolor]|uniref:cystatin-like n=1 Tax=Leptosomus discolor TaxID=188344 RepID=UPI0005228DE5
MAGVGVWVTLLAAALMFSGAVLGSSPLVGAPRTVANPENSEGLQRALRFAMEEYNKASNDMYASRVVRIISAKEQVGAGAAPAPRRDGL